MTAEERVKVRDWARRNLGKEVTIIDTNIAIRTSKAMVVGYSEFRVFGEKATNVLVHSPLNVSFWMADLDNIEEYVKQK